MPGRFTPRRGAGRELARSAEMGRYLGGVANAAASAAESRLPYPEILGGVTIQGDVRQGSQGQEGVVVISGPGWHLWEFGTVNHGARPAVRPGVQAAISRAGGRWRAN